MKLLFVLLVLLLLLAAYFFSGQTIDTVKQPWNCWWQIATVRCQAKLCM